MTEPFKDHFSAHAAQYARRRPRYPDMLFHFLATKTPGTRVAWDCATGNGQAAVGLVQHFDMVVATDASAAQLEHAVRHPRISYRVAPAERSGLPEQSVDLIVVAQALHWFNLQAFYEEVRRVLRPRGVIAAWCYNLLRVSPDIDALLLDFYSNVIGPYWPPERESIESGYSRLPFPFRSIATRRFAMRESWTAHELLGYIATWSAVQACIRTTSRDPMLDLTPALHALWGDPDTPRLIHWPMALRVGKLPHDDFFRHSKGYRIEGGEIDLVLGHCYPPERDSDQVPAYSFDICARRDGRRAGNITLRVGHNDYIDRYIGNIGYHVDAPYRGRRFAAHACRLVRALARDHGLSTLWITCNPDNEPSRRTCEIIGAEYVETVAVPEDTDLYLRGDRMKRRYRWDLTESQQ